MTRAVLAAMLALFVVACGPSLATVRATNEIDRLDAQCSAELDELHFEPGPNPDGEARVQAVLAGCQERARTFCAEHHLTHTNARVCP